MNIPTRESVEAEGGVYFGWFFWPLRQEEVDEFHSFKAAPGQIRSECPLRSQGRVVVYSMPYPNNQTKAAA